MRCDIGNNIFGLIAFFKVYIHARLKKKWVPITFRLVTNVCHAWKFSRSCHTETCQFFWIRKYRSAALTLVKHLLHSIHNHNHLHAFCNQLPFFHQDGLLPTCLLKKFVIVAYITAWVIYALCWKSNLALAQISITHIKVSLQYFLYFFFPSFLICIKYSINAIPEHFMPLYTMNGIIWPTT